MRTKTLWRLNCISVLTVKRKCIKNDQCCCYLACIWGYLLATDTGDHVDDIAIRTLESSLIRNSTAFLMLPTQLRKKSKSRIQKQTSNHCRMTNQLFFWTLESETD